MIKQNSNKRLRSVFRWIFWVLLVQFILINISTAFYAYKFTHLYSARQKALDFSKPVSENALKKTWRIFSGTKVYKTSLDNIPTFPCDSIQLVTKNGVDIKAWESKPDSLTKGTVVLFHGLTGNKGLVLMQAHEFIMLGYKVMLVDTRAHGSSSGSTTTIGYREAEEVKLAYDYLTQKGEDRIFLWGVSMGAVEIIKAVADYGLKTAGIILEMPFGSLEAHVKARMSSIGFPRQPFGSLVTFWIGVERGFNGLGFDVDEYASKINVPVLLQYGSNDQLVSRAEIDAIYHAIPTPHKRLVIYDHAGHSSLLSIDPATWKREVGSFMTTVLM